MRGEQDVRLVEVGRTGSQEREARAAGRELLSIRELRGRNGRQQETRSRGRGGRSRGGVAQRRALLMTSRVG